MKKLMNRERYQIDIFEEILKEKLCLDAPKVLNKRGKIYWKWLYINSDSRAFSTLVAYLFCAKGYDADSLKYDHICWEFLNKGLKSGASKFCKIWIHEKKEKEDFLTFLKKEEKKNGNQ